MLLDAPSRSLSVGVTLDGALDRAVRPRYKERFAEEVRVPQRQRDARVRQLVQEHIDFAARTLRNLGVPAADVDDGVQRVFLVIAERLADIRPGAERSFVFQTAHNVALHARRTLARRREVSEENAPDAIDADPTPEAIADERRARGLLDRVLATLNDDLRVVFVLFELEELTMEEIARVLGIPRGTVASRLRRARECFTREVQALHGPARKASP